MAHPYKKTVQAGYHHKKSNKNFVFILQETKPPLSSAAAVFAISKKNNSTRTDTHKSFKAKQRFNLNSVSMKKFIHFLELISFQGKLTFAQKKS